MPAELLYEDTSRDLAFLRVKSSVPPLRVAESYTFRKGKTSPPSVTRAPAASSSSKTRSAGD